MSARGQHAPDLNNPLAPGSIVADRYEVAERLGEGGMGTVYRAFDRQLEEWVALKLVHLAVDCSKQELKNFHQEVKLARRVTHPNVARTHDIGEHEGRRFLTMEYIEGTSLDALLEEPFAEARAVNIALAVARGLEAAHAANVLHRDLKPANLMIEPDGRVVITDFGIARQLVRGDDFTKSQVLGTPYYMSPEQVLSKPLDARSDIYSLGLILYEMLTCDLPFEGASPMAEVVARCHYDPIDPRDFGPLSDSLAEVVLRCLSRDPAQRYSSAAELAQRLESWAGATGDATVSIAPHAALQSGQPGSSHRPGLSNQPSMTSPLYGSGEASQPGIHEHPSVSGAFAPLKLGDRTLAVMPFRYQGSRDVDYLGDSLTEELIDLLSRTRGLRVIAFGATQALRDNPDAADVGRKLGAEAIITGHVQLMGGHLRVSVRLLDVASGIQTWSERFEREFEDVFAIQDIISQRIADALRIEIDLAPHRWRVDATTMDLYLRGRHLLQQDDAGAAAAIFQRCIAQSEGFKPAIAARARAAVRATWTDIMDESTHDLTATAKAVQEALDQAGDMAESRLAAAMFASQQDDLKTTASELRRALDIAPTYATAHRYLGELQTEAGRIKEGVRHSKLALELDPSDPMPYYTLARVAALDGDRAALEHALGKLEETGRQSIAMQLSRVRFASWLGDREAIERFLANASPPRNLPDNFALSFAKYLLGQEDEAALDPVVAFVEEHGSGRLQALVAQLAAEAHAARGNLERAQAMLQQAADKSLFDIEWVERCPLLQPLRSKPDFAPIAAQVRRRAAALWQV